MAAVLTLTMAITEVHGATAGHLQDIATIVARAKKVVVFTGAGISTNCGIPVSTVPRIVLEVNAYLITAGLSLQNRALLPHQLRVQRQERSVLRYVNASQY